MSLLYIFLFIQIDIFFGKEFSEAIEKKQVGNIDHIAQVINSYVINELVTIKEFRDTEDECRIYLSKCPSDCPDESIFTMFHAFRHYRSWSFKHIVNNFVILLLDSILQGFIPIPFIVVATWSEKY